MNVNQILNLVSPLNQRHNPYFQLSQPDDQRWSKYADLRQQRQPDQ